MCVLRSAILSSSELVGLYMTEEVPEEVLLLCPLMEASLVVEGDSEGVVASRALLGIGLTRATLMPPVIVSSRRPSCFCRGSDPFGSLGGS